MLKRRHSEIPVGFDRVILHQIDLGAPSPGGIDTCIRGILKYEAAHQRIAVVGVDSGRVQDGRALGKWEVHCQEGGGEVWFLPVARLDPANQRRVIPHSLRLILGFLRYRRYLPSHQTVQAHRMDTALAASYVDRAELSYFIHTQASGLTGKTSDSLWRRAGWIHERLERRVVRSAAMVAVFNPEYAKQLRRVSRRVSFFPTWFDPTLNHSARDREERHIVWVGRVEEPKNPVLAVEAFASLPSDGGWRLTMVGTGTLLKNAKEAATRLGVSVDFSGRLEPSEVAGLLGRADVFLMTSHAGYEGFPRVLVEAMASGLRPVVTSGSDTGDLVHNGVTGFKVRPDSSEIARSIVRTQEIDRETVQAAVSRFSAPAVVGEIYAVEARVE